LPSARASAGHRRVGPPALLLASGSMSHRFWPLSVLHLHEASDPIHISRPEAREADLERLEWFRGDHASVIDTMPEFLKHVPEARFGHYLMMAGACGGRGPGRACVIRLRERHRHQPGHVWFARP
jgi:aromatic ring-opening dioxygenase catalytic subunit (LigB family)